MHRRFHIANYMKAMQRNYMGNSDRSLVSVVVKTYWVCFDVLIYTPLKIAFYT